MKSLYLVLVTCLGYSIFLTDCVSSKCDGDGKNNTCKTFEDWRLNILCRLQGGPSPAKRFEEIPDDGKRQNGYIAWAMNHNGNESSRDRRTRYDAMRFFIHAEHELKISYPNRKPKDRKGMLERFEKGIDDWGRKLAKLGSMATTSKISAWTTSDKKCGITAGGYIPSTTCGERDHEPVCPIASDSPAPGTTTTTTTRRPDENEEIPGFDIIQKRFL